MFLFILSFLLVFTSSYFIASVITPKKSILGLIYLFLIAFAQLVLTFEVLSLFTAINQSCVLGANFLFLIVCSYIWNKKSRPLWSLDFKDFKNKVNNSLKLDKSLIWLYVAFCVLIIVSIVLCLLMPLTNADAYAYHAARSVFWVLQGSLNHFDVADIRNLCLPINSEILYSWVILFIKKDVLFGFFSFVGYLLSIISIYNILSILGYCTRKKLWVIFILSSFSSVIVQLSGTETDIIIAGLATSCIFLFWHALKNNEKVPIFMASLAYALALGTKTTSIIAMPGVGFLLLFLCFYYKKYKPLLWFLGLGLINFLIFSSYNYILNYMQFSNFMGSTSFMVVSKNYYGLKGMLANFIKYIFMAIDFTGLKWSDYINSNLVSLREQALGFIHLNYIKDGLYTTPFFINSSLVEPVMGAGVLGFLVYVPCLIWSLVKPVFNLKSRSPKTWFIFAFALAFIINILSISYLLAYMTFSVRFIMSFIVVSSPILVHSYLSPKNPIKYIIITFALFYLVCISTHLWARPFSKLGDLLLKHPSITYLRNIAQCKEFSKQPIYTNSVCPLTVKIRTDYSKDNKIIAFLSAADNIYFLKALEFEGYKIDFRRLEDIKKIDLSQYNIIISTRFGQKATLIKEYEQRKNEYKIIGREMITSKENIVPCIYTQNQNIKTANNNEKFYPYEVKCGMSRNFLLKNDLEPIAATGVIKPKIGDIDYYIIYRNTRLPLKFKKKNN